MDISDFDFELPPALIARHPPAERRASRLLHVAADGLHDRRFAELPTLLAPGDLLVFNDTRVIRARLHGRKQTGGAIEILIERLQAGNSALAHIKASKSPRAGMRLDLRGGATAIVRGRVDDLYELHFDRPLAAYLETHGEVPLPPYLGRDAEAADDERYQTVYAKADGAVAAPTAGLHFDRDMMAETQASGVGHAYVTLHVGAGTFQPLREENLKDNRLHAERLSVGEQACNRVRETRARGGRVVAVGTTAVRALESAAISGELQPVNGETELFITPGYEFLVVDAMLTNFHLPRSSLLMLVSAFAGQRRIREAYSHAVGQRYRFFSYGDAMFLERSRR